MPVTVAQALTLFGGIASVAGVLATAYLVVKSTLSKTTVKLWKDEAEALKARLVTVEASDAQCKERLAGLEAANRVLSDQVSGAGAVALMHSAMEKQFAGLSDLLSEMKRGNKAAEKSADTAASEIVENR